MVLAYRILLGWSANVHSGETTAVEILRAQVSKLIHSSRLLAPQGALPIPMTLLAVGTVAFDTIETPTSRRDRILGGSATFFSIAASLFTNVRLVGMVGKDWPVAYSDLLASRGIDLAGLVVHPSFDTYFWHGRYTQDLQDRQTLAFEMNGFDQFNPVLPEEFRDCQDVFLGAACPAVQLKTLAQCTNPRWVVADTVDAWIETARNDLGTLLQQIDCLLINDSEVRQLSGLHNLVGAGKWLLTQGPSKVIIKKGEHGCLFLDKHSVVPFPAFPCENVVDPTGAGDSFAGGMMGYLANQEKIDRNSILQAIQMGTVMASFTIEDFSVDGLLRISKRDVEQRHQEFSRSFS